MKYTILTLFPDLVRPWTEESIVQKAIQKGLIEVDIRDIRAHTEDKHKTVDDTPYGGGAGMVMRVDVVVRAIEAAGLADEVILLTPAGQPLTQRLVEELAGKSHLVLVCGRYEGIDARVEHFVTREISIGDYVLMGGELGALVILEATARLLPGSSKRPRATGRTPSLRACWTTPTTPAHRCSGAWRCRKSSPRGTMPKLPSGGANRPSSAPKPAAPTCSSGPS